ncbi:alpha/beta fold hydrolase [Streptomyces decoyicus]
MSTTSNTHRRRRSWKRWSTGAVVACAAAVLALPMLPERGQASAGSAPSTITWRPCAGHRDAQCGSLPVPVDWAAPGKTVRLEVARRKATSPAKRIGVLLVNPGGPGGSGVDMALGSQFPAELRARFDIVGFDPRGIGRSHPIKCSKRLIDNAPRGLPRNQREFDRLVSHNRELRQDCRKLSGPLFDHADTLNVVRDMDALRAGLGEEKINYFGHSYGTLIGQQYAEKFGGRIRSMVLDSNMDHSLRTKDLAVTAAAAVEDSLKEFVRWCKTTPACALHGQDVLLRWDRLLAAADRGALYESAAPVSAADIISRAYEAFSSGPPEWPQLAKWLTTLRFGRPHPQGNTPRTSQPPGTEPHGRDAVFCQDWKARIRDYRELQALVRAESAAAPHARTSPEMRQAILSCIGWPRHVNNPQRPGRMGSQPPVILLANARHDPATGYTWARNVQNQAQKKTRLLTYDGWGHGAIGTTCTMNAVNNYLIHRSLPRPDASCPASRN